MTQCCFSVRVRLTFVATLAFVAAFSASISAPPVAFAQGPGREARPIPSARYYDGVRLIESGAFREAVLFYQSELKGAERIGTSQWIDSICYYAMLGEAYYQAGDLNAALENYKAAITTSLTFPNWLSRVTFMTGLSTAPKTPAPWGASSRVCPLGVFPKTAVVTVGDLITKERLQQGGIIKSEEARQIDAAEILRCTALAIRRRTEILGPLAQYDPTSERILNAYSNRSVPANHWSVTWLDVLFGLALSESGKPENATRVLRDALLIGGRCDHQFTGIALHELGALYLKSDKVREAATCFYEASISAFNYGDRLLAQEALRDYSNAKKALGDEGADRTIAAAFAWAKTQKRPLLSATLGLELVEELIYAGKTNLAANGLAATEKSMSSPVSAGLRTSRAADRWNYLNALLCYSNGDVGGGDAALAKVVEGMKLRSPWALQLTRLDQYVKSGLTSNGPLTPRNAADLYEYLLREPTVVDWAYRPTESLAIQMIAPSGAYERWFQILFDRDLKDKAFEVSERIRRERFFSTQTYGGRLVSLRYLLMANDALTTTSVRAARQQLLLEYPRFDELTKEARAISEALDGTPTVAQDKETRANQAQASARLAEISVEQEALLRLIAAGRVRIPYVFPPVLSVANVQKRLPDDSAILAFLDANGETFGFMIGKTQLDSWRVGPTARVGAAVATFLRTIGCVEGSRQIDATELSAARWKTQGDMLRKIVLGADDVEADRFNILFTKLVVVPDSVLWYLPFEALCLPAIAAEATENDPAAPTSDPNAANDAAPNETPDETPSEPTKNSDDETAKIDELFDALSSDAPSDDETDAAPPTDERPVDAPQNETAPPTPRPAPTSEKSAARAIADDDPAAETPSAESVAETQDADVKDPKRKSRSAREKEALDAKENSLISMIQTPGLTIRYSATVGLALPNALGRNAFVETTLAVGSTFAKQTPETLEAAVERFAAAVPKTQAGRVGAIVDASGALYAARLKRLVVWNEIVADSWNWTPIAPSETKRGNGLADWIFAPWGAPRLIVLPALRTRAESAMKNGGDGSELFLSILAAQSSGADAMLLSRWRTGGRSAFDLTTDFVKNYESSPVADAWKRAVAALSARDVVVDEEPRLRKPGRSDPTPKYDLPFWWAGYLLVDSGEAVGADEIEKFDVDAAAKMAAENATLDGQNAAANPDAANDPNAANNPDSANDPNAAPIVVDKTSTKDDGESLNLGPRVLDDETLRKNDEAGEDFFETDDEPSADDQKPTPDSETNADEPK